MEGERQWAFTAPAFGAAPAPLPSRPPPGIYCPTGWRKRRRQEGSSGQRRAKRRKAAAAPPPAAPPLRAAAPHPAANPAQLAPLRCFWPHPAVQDLLAQQCWPVAGAAAALAPRSAPQGHLPAAASGMLPSSSLLYPPLAQQQEALLASDKARPLPQPNILVGYKDDWLEVTPQVLPLWAATPLAPFGGPKPLLHYLVCPDEQEAAARQFVKDVGSLYETCGLGSHQPGSGASVHTFSLVGPPGAAGTSADAAAAARELRLGVRYLAGLRHACEQVQRELLLDPPAELWEHQGSSLEEGSEPAVLVYVACPLEQQADVVAALMEAAACLAPCTTLGADEDSALSLLWRGTSATDLGGGGSMPQMLEPCAPQPPDRPASATPATDNSRAPGGSPPPVKQQADEWQGQQAGQQLGPQGQQQAGEQARQQQRYHGAAAVLHQQQRGDFRQLPVQRLERPEGSRTFTVVLQLITPSALADLSGTAARCTAFAVYSKVQRPLATADGQHEEAEPGEAVQPGLPFCSQPLLVLAPTSQQQQQQQQQWEDGECVDVPASRASGASSVQLRTLHCCYGRLDDSSTLLPLAFTDSYGELVWVVWVQMLDTMAGRLGSLGMAGSSSDSLLEAGSSAAGSTAAPHYCRRPCTTFADHVCRQVLQQCAALLATLRAASSPPNQLHSLAITGVGMPQGEQEAWRALLDGGGTDLAAELPPGAEVAVLDVQALPPARLTGPDPPSGCKLLLQNGEQQGPLQACVACLPSSDARGGASLLPQEHDTVRQLQVVLAARRQPDVPADGDDGCLQRMAEELHGLAWLHMAFQGACLRSVAGSGPAAGADAHLPLHVALAGQLQSLLTEVTSK